MPHYSSELSTEHPSTSANCDVTYGLRTEERTTRMQQMQVPREPTECTRASTNRNGGTVLRNQEAPSAQKRTHGGRKVGHNNYTADELDKLLELVQGIEPIGAQMWADVAERYVDWAVLKGFPVRDQDALKQKFDRLANTQKSTGDPLCPPAVRKAKQIAHAILGRASADSIGGGFSNENESIIELHGSRTDVIGSKTNRRRPGTTGVCRFQKGRRTSEDIIDLVGDVASKIGDMANAILQIMLLT